MKILKYLKLKVNKIINHILYGDDLMADNDIRPIVLAIKKRNNLIKNMDCQCYKHAGCCPSCMFGSQYNYLVDKNERAFNWLLVIAKRRNKKVYWTDPSDIGT